MAKPDIGNYADVGIRDFRKRMHFPEIRYAHLQHSDFMFLPDLKYGKREPDFIIKISCRLMYTEFFF